MTNLFWKSIRQLMNIQIAKKPITETESDQASPDLAN